MNGQESAVGADDLAGLVGEGIGQLQQLWRNRGVEAGNVCAVEFHQFDEHQVEQILPLAQLGDETGCRVAYILLDGFAGCGTQHREDRMIGVFISQHCFPDGLFAGKVIIDATIVMPAASAI